MHVYFLNILLFKFYCTLQIIYFYYKYLKIYPAIIHIKLINAFSTAPINGETISCTIGVIHIIKNIIYHNRVQYICQVSKQRSEQKVRPFVHYSLLIAKFALMERLSYSLRTTTLSF